MNDITIRFLECYDYLKSVKIVHTPKGFANEIQVSTSLITEICKKRTNAGLTPIQNLLNRFSQINPDWLLTGLGNMLRKGKEDFNFHLIPLYDGVMTASMASQDLPAQSQPVEMVNAGDWFRDATSAMRVHGDSMFPDYVSGSIVAMKEVVNKQLAIPGQDYLIETSEYRVLKRLQKSDLPKNWLLCSTNEDVWENGPLKGRLIHEPFDIAIDDVNKICLILGSVKRNHSSRIVGL